MIAIAMLQHNTADGWAYGGLMAFVMIAVPVIVWRSFCRQAVAPGDLPA
jgi:hypothetical protein